MRKRFIAFGISPLTWGLVLCSLLAAGSSANAALVQEDFNYLNVNNVVIDVAPQGTGFTGDWAGSTWIRAVNGDLVAPASTNFGLVQSGPGRAIEHNGGDQPQTRRIYRELDTALGGANSEIWFSYLVQPTHDSSRVGLTINPFTVGGGATAPAIETGSDVRIVAYGDQLRVGFSGMVESNTATITAGSFTLGQTSLIIGKIEIGAPGDIDVLSLWIDPDVGNLGAPVFTYGDSTWLTGDVISSIGVIGYATPNNTAGRFDFLTMSDNPGAYFEVTGIPEPSTWGLLGAGALSLVGWGAFRRRRSDS